MGKQNIPYGRGFYDGWKKAHSIFEWADKGEWKSRDEEQEDLDGRMFRIGFEPLFVDYTREGAVYIIFLLSKWFATGVTAGSYCVVPLLFASKSKILFFFLAVSVSLRDYFVRFFFFFFYYTRVFFVLKLVIVI